MKKDRIHSCFEINAMFQTAVHCFVVVVVVVFFMHFERGLELLKVKLYRNELKGNKNYRKLAGGSSYQGYITVNV